MQLLPSEGFEAWPDFHAFIWQTLWLKKKKKWYNPRQSLDARHLNICNILRTVKLSTIFKKHCSCDRVMTSTHWCFLE